ncbi:AAA family ATPase [Methylorubrum extorquens]|uniref:AAA family ATPase n=1 Tax=Methylorubrum extorquens TaxID=408 RepID=UPI001EE553BB|nr:AAA family ATPase [Methylorubrum extorquens]MCG5246102.1 AAA family ATPase [Methylorubrum extorquens]
MRPSPRRMVIHGPPGSGKSTLARQLGARHGLPAFHLDRAYWRPGWIEAEPAAFRAEVERIAALPAWVIDGNYTDTIAPRFARADTVIYLDMPAWRCTARVLRRTLSSLGQVRPAGPEGCPEQLTLEFLRDTASWNRIRRASHLALVESFAGHRVVLRGSPAVRRFAAG